MELVLISVVVVAFAMLAMSVGVLFSNRCLRGSCGGPEVLGPDGESLNCATCPNRETSEGEGRQESDPVVTLGSADRGA